MVFNTVLNATTASVSADIWQSIATTASLLFRRNGVSFLLALKKERGSLWVRIIKSIHGENGRLGEGSLEVNAKRRWGIHGERFNKDGQGEDFESGE
ncbi:hypothetical protein Tco_0999312 [Tanacetum coccineum]